MILVMDRIQLKPAFRFVCACFTHNTKNNNTVSGVLTRTCFKLNVRPICEREEQ